MKTKSAMRDKETREVTKGNLVLVFFLLLALSLTYTGIPAQDTSSGNIVVIADEDLAHLEILQSGIKEHAIWTTFDKSMDPISALEMVIREHAPVSELHVFTHGKPGAMTFAYDEINQGTLHQQEEQLITWKDSFTKEGSILLYGCEMGKGAEGKSFVKALSQLVGINVAASENLTGASANGGDWILEVKSGSQDVPTILTETAMRMYPDVLAKILVFDIDGPAYLNGAVIVNFYNSLPGHSAVLLQNNIPDLEEYNIVYVVQPTRVLTDTEIENLKKYLERGGMIIFQGEHGGYTAAQNNNISNALTRLGAGFSIINEATDGGWTGCNNDLKGKGIIREHPVFEGVNTMEYNYTGSVALGSSSQALITNRTVPSKTFMAMEKVSNGHILLFADQNVWDRVANTNCNNNAIFFENLLKFSTQNISKITTTTTVQLKMNDHAPVIEDGQHFNIDENSAGSTLVGTVLATDQDGDEEFVQWTITGGNTNDAFSINEETGEITVNNTAALDYEVIKSFTLMITVSDGEHVSEAEAVIIQLNNLNDNAPVILAGQQFMLDENSPVNTLAGTVVATDMDGDEFVQWTITDGNTNDAFSINEETGEITVNNTAALDYEVIKSFTLMITVSDGEHVSEVEAVIIQLNNLNDNPPVIAAGQIFSLDENSAAGTIVGKVIATDADGTIDFQHWTIISGNVNQAFQIDVSTGIVSVLNSEALDYELITSFTLTISVSDGLHVSQQTIIITLRNVNDHAPTDILLSNHRIEEWMNAGTQIGLFTTKDNDAVDHHTYSLVSGSGDVDNAKFSIESNQLIAVTEFDFDFQRTFTIRVRTTDSGEEIFEKTFVLKLEANPVIDLMIPTAFSPNGDNVNDTWEIDRLLQYPDAFVRIFNSDGTEVFSNRGYTQQWNGTHHGKPMPFGTYYYVISLNGERSRAYKGTVMILK